MAKIEPIRRILNELGYQGKVLQIVVEKTNKYAALVLERNDHINTVVVNLSNKVSMCLLSVSKKDAYKDPKNFLKVRIKCLLAQRYGKTVKISYQDKYEANEYELKLERPIDIIKSWHGGTTNKFRDDPYHIYSTHLMTRKTYGNWKSASEFDDICGPPDED